MKQWITTAGLLAAGLAVSATATEDASGERLFSRIDQAPFEKQPGMHEEKRWAIPITISGMVCSGAFDNTSQSSSLSNTIFGQPFTIKDVYLFSKLSDDNKIRSLNQPAARFFRGGLPITSAQPFGFFRDDLVTTLVAPAEVQITADKDEFSCDVSCMRQFRVGKREKLQAICGVTFPFKSVEHRMDLSVIGGALFREAFNADRTIRENTLKQFFREYASLEDFFVRAVLGSKGLSFDRRKRVQGLGDIELHAVLDWADFFSHLDALQTGVACTLPTAARASGTAVWEPVLGNDGAFSASFFAHALFVTPLHVFNPSIRLAAEFATPSAATANGTRVPRLITQPQTRVMVKEVPDLDSPDIIVRNFEELWVDAFSEYDSALPAFAGTTASVKLRKGSQVTMSVGNYVYDLFNLGMRFGLLYTYLHKNQDKVRCSAPNLNTCSLMQHTKSHAHTIGWSLAYSFKNMVELNAGSEHIVAGHNIPREHRFFVSCVLVF